MYLLSCGFEFYPRTQNNYLIDFPKQKFLLVHNNYNFSFFNFLENLNEKFFHQKRLERLVKKVYNFVSRLSPAMNDFFLLTKTLNNCRGFQSLYSDNIRAFKFGSETVTYRRPKICVVTPENM